MNLRETLTHSKPSLRCRPGIYSNGRSHDWPVLKKQNLVSWDEFNLDNLNASYGHVLDSPIPAESQDKFPKPNAALFPIEQLAGPADALYLVRWNAIVLRQALDFARKKQSLETGTGIAIDYNPTGPRARGARPSVCNRKNTGRFQADHIVQLEDVDGSTSLVVGLGRTSVQFPKDRLVNRTCDPYPFRQLANLCDHARTRYGYLITNEMFVACCFSKDGPEEDPSWTVATKAVHWTKHGPTQLTTDLALWWLCMLALSDVRNRRLTGRADMVSIDHWHLHLYDDERGWVRRHHYSLREEPTEPPTPPPYRSPSPDNVVGNAAVFEAAVGVNADLGFDLYAPNAAQNAQNAHQLEYQPQPVFNLGPQNNLRHGNNPYLGAVGIDPLAPELQNPRQDGDLASLGFSLAVPGVNNAEETDWNANDDDDAWELSPLVTFIRDD